MSSLALLAKTKGGVGFFSYSNIFHEEILFPYEKHTLHV